MKIILIVWRPYCRRGESFAKKFRAKLYKIHYLRYRKPIVAPIKYFIQTVKSLIVFFSVRPDVIFSINPPIFCVLITYLYCKVFNKRYVIDSDTGAFYPPWTSRVLLPLSKFLCRNAVATVVTNKSLAAIVNSWGGKSFVIEDPLPEFPDVKKTSSPNGFRVTLINTFSADEPTDVFVNAAKDVPEGLFYVTGDPSYAPKALIKSKPGNVIFTGFLPEKDYLALLESSDAVAVLCTENFTLNCGAYEAIAMGKPLILSDWQVLKNYFRAGVIFVDNTTQSIAEGIRKAMSNKGTLAKEIVQLKSTLNSEWDAKFDQLKNIIEGKIPS